MTELLTQDEYEVIARDLTLPTTAFINGRFSSAKSGRTFSTVNPANGSTIAEIAACEAEDIDHAVTKAREAFEQGVWSRMPPVERKHALIRREADQAEPLRTGGDGECRER
jgi:gamma-glutamyl-gamma-aminobutyraldehyde dehydrogenase